MKTLSWHKDLLLCNSGDDFRDVKSSLELDLTKIPGYDSRLTCNSSCMCTWAESQLCYRDTSITYSSWSSPLWDWNQESKNKASTWWPIPAPKASTGPFLSCCCLSSGIPWCLGVYFSVFRWAESGSVANLRRWQSRRGLLIFGYFREFRTARGTCGKTFQKPCRIDVKILKPGDIQLTSKVPLLTPKYFTCHFTGKEKISGAQLLAPVD